MIKQGSANSESEYQIKNLSTTYQQASVGERFQVTKSQNFSSKSHMQKEITRGADSDKLNYLQLIGGMGAKALEAHKNIKDERQ